MSSLEGATFNKAVHIRYWLRCLKTYLPTQYTSNDSQRATLAFFTLSALDLLGVLHERTTTNERSAYAEWIYKCQHPDGGFRGFTGADTGSADPKRERCWDPANMAATYFSLASLAILGDDMERVKRRECLKWIRKLQLEDGSFGEAIGKGGKVEGGKDTRYCYCAIAVRWILWTGDASEQDVVEDIDVEALVKFITSSQSYDGGISSGPFHEASAGWTYCGIGTLSLLSRLPSSRDKDGTSISNKSEVTQDFIESVIHFLVSCQTSKSLEAEYDVSDNGAASNFSKASVPNHQQPLFHVQGAFIIQPDLPQAVSPLEILPEELQCAGFSGRCNKVADTCYSFWAGGALAILQRVHLLNFNANRRFLLSKAQHIIGGFGKYPGDPPDLLHSYLGLAALATMREPELKSIDPMLCISVSAREWLQSRMEERRKTGESCELRWRKKEDAVDSGR